MTREQAIRRAVELSVIRRSQYVVVAEHFRRHRPSFHIRDERQWRSMRRLRAEGSGYTNWSEVWPSEEAVKFKEAS